MTYFLEFLFPLLSIVLVDVKGAIEGYQSQFGIEDPLSHFKSDDYSQFAPQLDVGGRVMDLLNGEHYDDILRDSPYAIRPPSIIAFYDSDDNECFQIMQQIDFEDGVSFKLPSRAHLIAARYDMSAVQKRAWYKFIPERDLANRFGVTKCPSLVWVPRECDGFTDWCTREESGGIAYLGCDEYVDKCGDLVTVYDIAAHINSPKDNNNWIDWVLSMLENSTEIDLGYDHPGKRFASFEEQEGYVKHRDHSTTRENLRNVFIPPTLPAFSKHGFKAVPIPDELYTKLITFYQQHVQEKVNENWHTTSTTVNGHEIAPSLISLDLDMRFRDEIANMYIKPLLEEWVGFPLRLTSFYGIREYYSGSWLKNHVDRIDVLVISATLSLAHLVNNTDMNVLKNDFTVDDYKKNYWFDENGGNIHWPIEGIDWNGNNVRYNHNPGTLIMYESAKFIHGRPYPLPYGWNEAEQKYNLILQHLGVFCHFVPADGSWSKLKHDKNARANINRNTRGVNYKTNPVYYPHKHKIVEKENEEDDNEVKNQEKIEL